MAAPERSWCVRQLRAISLSASSTLRPFQNSSINRLTSCSFVGVPALRGPAAAVLVFLPAAARTRLVAADFRHGAAHRQIELHFPCSIAIAFHACNRTDRLRLAARSGRRRRTRGVFAQQKLRQGCEEIFEGLQVRGAAEKIVQHFVLNVRHQLDEHLVGLGLVFDERIFLRVTAQINAFAQRIHRVEMLLPETVDRVQNDVTLEAFHRRRLFVTRLALVRFLDLLDQELRVLLHACASRIAPFPR